MGTLQKEQKKETTLKFKIIENELNKNLRNTFTYQTTFSCR